MKEMQRAGAGYEFGGLALDEEGGRRKATVVALKDTHFMVLNKESYQQIVGLEQKKRINKLMAMLADTYYFVNVPKQIMSSFVVFMQFQKFSFGDVIMKWKKKPDTMFIVFEGIVALLREKKVTIEDNQMKLLEEGIDKSKEITVGNPLLSKGYKKVVVIEELCLRETGMTFGEEFIVLDKPAEYQAVARSKVVIVASISSEIVKKKLFHFMPSCKKDFEKAVIERYNLGFSWKKELKDMLKPPPSQYDIFKALLNSKVKGEDNLASYLPQFKIDIPREGYKHEIDHGGLLK